MTRPNAISVFAEEEKKQINKNKNPVCRTSLVNANVPNRFETK